MPRLSRKRLVGKDEDLERLAREQEYRTLVTQMWRDWRNDMFESPITSGDTVPFGVVKS
jgi:hypothetical protein